MFHEPTEININNKEEFEDSDYAGAQILLSVTYSRLRFASTERDEEDKVSELYYFIEANGELLNDEEDNLFLYSLDDIKFVLLDDCQFQHIIIKDRDVEEVNTMFN